MKRNMNPAALQALTAEQLVETFRDCSYEQAGAIGDDSNDYSRASELLSAIGDELRRRGPGARRALLPLLDCSGTEAGPWKAYSAGSQCRYNAAWQLLAVEPSLARQTLRDLAANGSSYAQFLARKTLANLEDGSLKPA